MDIQKSGRVVGSADDRWWPRGRAVAFWMAIFSTKKAYWIEHWAAFSLVKRERCRSHVGKR
ncbi:hypothetical protein EON65_56215 [archaeon]|nr:MAG: hypothetical protein EON65_56215 [archaeon]